MIQLHSLSGKTFFLNEDHFERFEAVPDTVITLSNGNTYRVIESPEEILEKVVEFRGRYWTGLHKN